MSLRNERPAPRSAFDDRGKIANAKNHAVRAPGLLPDAARKGPGAGRLRTAEEDLQGPVRHARERGKLLVLEREPEVRRIEVDRALNVGDESAHAVELRYELHHHVLLEDDRAMLTADDIRSVPMLATLSERELEMLARTSADLHLAAGEFAVHEGGERALFGVLSGKIEVVKTVDGILRTIGWRAPERFSARSRSRSARRSRAGTARTSPRAFSASSRSITTRPRPRRPSCPSRSESSRASASGACRRSPPSGPRRASR
jgi:hypothetical protein